MAKVIKPPAIITKASFINRPSLVLFGSIENGCASLWQQTCEEYFAPYDVDVYNPRRDHWNTSCIQSINNSEFVNQVEWELTVLENASVKLFYFDPSTKSPISLAELGLSVGVGTSDIVVCCPEGFWRKGNVDIICKRYGVHMESTLQGALFDARSKLNIYHGMPMLEVKPVEEVVAPTPFEDL